MKYERLIGKPVNCLFLLVFSYLPLLPECFHAFLTERLVIHDLQSLGFSETFGRKMNTDREQLWDKLNHQERSIEGTAAGFFFSYSFTPHSMLVQWLSTSKASQVKFWLMFL